MPRNRKKKMRSRCVDASNQWPPLLAPKGPSLGGACPVHERESIQSVVRVGTWTIGTSGQWDGAAPVAKRRLARPRARPHTLYMNAASLKPFEARGTPHTHDDDVTGSREAGGVSVDSVDRLGPVRGTGLSFEGLVRSTRAPGHFGKWSTTLAAGRRLASSRGDGCSAAVLGTNAQHDE